MGDDIGSGSLTDCRLRSDSDLLSSTKLSYGKNQNKPFYGFWCHHPLMTQLSWAYYLKPNHCLPQNDSRFNFMQCNYCHEANENAVFSLHNHIVPLLVVDMRLFSPTKFSLLLYLWRWGHALRYFFKENK